MSTNPHRRSLIGLFASASLAGVAGVTPTSAMRRARMLSLSVGAEDRASATLGRMAEHVRGAGIPGIGAAIERAHPLNPDTPPELTELATSVDSDPASILARQAAEARMITALVVVFPPEIAAYRSFGAPMRRRLYAELIARESARLMAASPSPPREDAP
ncbi:hypothetical protein [Methylobacterium sp. E-046]|uniref:hypothetical protein n=1 Tax=Methylobacterium sp. E-046 TaxID=2836576 RepID=UPI001FBB8850|nr:hypothetical protein [Methylobacterium sp. E-046]MCJ2102420.1 hypothetical protein [Methylobacterium sp. E-046]